MDPFCHAELGYCRVAQPVACLTQQPEVPGSIPAPATQFRFSLRRVKKDSYQLLAKVSALSTGYPLRMSQPAQEKCVMQS